MSRDLKLLVPAAYGAKLKVSGKIGARPDIDIVDGSSTCARSRLPSFLDQLTFRVFFPGTPFFTPSPTAIQSFYHHGEFFIVSGMMKDFFDANCGSDMESAEVDVCYQDGSPVPERYFAVKIVRTIDCIDPSRSHCGSLDSNKKISPFTEFMVTYELDDVLADEFANGNGNKYISYPTFHRVGKICLIEDAIPAEAPLFRPAFWPSALLVATEFAERLERACTGGPPGYYFWTLGLDNVSDSFYDRMRTMG